MHRSFRLAFAAVLLFPLSLSAQTPKESDHVNEHHVLLQPWTGRFGGVPPWNQVRPEDFVAAFDLAIAQAEADVQAIADNPQPASFENTIVALEQAGQALDRLQSLFGVYTSNLNLGPVPDIERAVVPKLSEYEDSVTQNEKLFARIATVYESDSSDWTTAQKRLVDDRYKQFVRQGAKLNQSDKAKLSQINKRLARLFTDFSQNVLADEAGFVTWIEDKSKLAGLPDSVVAAMAGAAKQKNQPGKWAITNTRSSMDPFLTYADDRQLREQVWRNYYSRGDNGDEHDNNEIIAEILKLRAQRAKLLGYATHAHWRLEPQMAKTPENAMQLMMKVWPKAVARVAEEVADMQAVADEELGKDAIKIEPWDYRYYAEKVRKAKYDLDFNEVKPYLQLEKLREGMMWAAGELYGMQFKRVQGLPVFHPDVRVWEVTDADGKLIGLWYLDPYAREGKRSGAWMTAYRIQQNIDQPIAPIVSNNSNFVKGAEGEVVLISWDDAVTLFHEFGHALHGLSSDVKYPSQAGTSVARDYVEFPSQLNEHWLSTPEILNRFALHYETGEPMPAELLEKIERASTFNEGFATVEYLASALVDMKLHLVEDGNIDPDKFERETLAELGMPSEIVMRHRTPHFSHIFAGDGYSAGYYSYLWADALTADAAEAFEEAGGFYDPATVQRLYRHVMSVGDTVDPADGFRAFRGRDVDTKALLRKRGFPVD
ncbi:M3 family metallopeptidase [Roseimaritima ulvae]|uniref:Peptidyl-dipeptidase dcp n=1 Tax=Roseimaritima ulvae TaxID=980254 RepID=A0A5B9QS86_9BACT|nr:M3 family metallopeptidase [Roseimaritima ulvae]QEG41854.1 Peptidyl-dipeptidase dcp [Roseimaritima ulvae]